MAFDRDDLIRELGKNFQVPVKEEEQDNRRFYENTQTLLSEKDLKRLKKIEEEQRKENRHEMALQTSVYSEIILGRRPFLVVKDEGYIQGDTLVLREYDNLKATGNMNIKILSLVEKGVPGIADGYCVLSWN